MRELLLRYLHEHVRIVKMDDFVIDGIIDKVTEDCILFSSKGRERVIKFEAIREVVPLERGRR